MKVTILGSGTSMGVPVLGCSCAVCRSSDPKNQRLRVSVLVETQGKKILIDTSPDLRQQALRAGVTCVDAILFTHAHADHAHGVDDTRLFNVNNRFQTIPTFASPDTAELLLARFGYCFGLSSYPGAPKLSMTAVSGKFEAVGVPVEAVPLPHGQGGMVYGFRFGAFAYLTDCNDVPPAAMERLRGLEVLVLDCLRKEPHPTHLHLARSLELAREIGARRTLLTHLSHDIGASEAAGLPAGVELAWDGMQFEAAESAAGERAGGVSKSASLLN